MNKSNKKTIIASNEYKQWIEELKNKFQQSQIKASVQVNRALLEFYWELGREIIEKQKNTSWGSGFLQQLSNDLTKQFPNVKGFSKRNLELIRKWFQFYNSEIQITKQVVSQLLSIPWGHNLNIVSKCKDIKEALFYVQKTLENGWSRSVLIHQIETNLYKRQGKALTNFSQTLPKIQSDLAKELIKDPYNLNFLILDENYKEKDLENALLEHVTKFLLELGSGFAFVGKQQKLKVGEKEFYIDLLFYHIKMHCYIVVELKTVDFEPEFAGKLNFYIKAVDEQIKTEHDNPTIGILLCKSKDKIVVEYSLSNITNPMGISQYTLEHEIPEELKQNLPSIEDIEAELRKDS